MMRFPPVPQKMFPELVVLVLNIALMVAVICGLTACDVPSAVVAAGKDGKDGASAGISSRAATASECLNGGVAIETWTDVNSDGVYEADTDKNDKVAVVCNGSNGQSGHAIVSVSRAATVAECPATAGTAVDLWTDVNDNGTYQIGVDTGFRTLVACDGAVGATGATGATGADGQDAVLSSGAVGPMVSGQSYSACHHDYLYLANGWLLFRHQANGGADQGVGTTGFNVWNVDMSDFALASEVGGVTYCNLHFDKVAHTLSYTVVDSSNGLNGLSGVIAL